MRYPDIDIGLSYDKEDGWCAFAKCGDGDISIYGKWHGTPESCLCSLVLEMARALYVVGATDHLAQCHAGFEESLTIGFPDNLL